MIRDNQEMSHFVQTRRASVFRKYPSEVSHKQIIEAIINKDLFGFIEVDLEVPSDWDQTQC